MIREKNELTNTVNLSGTVITKPELSHSIGGEHFYKFKLSIKRKSKTADILNVIISERLTNFSKINENSFINIFGEFRSRNVEETIGEETKNRLMLYVYPQEVTILDEELNENEITLMGYLVKKPIVRKTPLGKDICDLLLGVHRISGKSDYIPTIVWNRNAMYMGQFKAGTYLKLSGNIQSRVYTKKIDEEAFEERTAFEVSSRFIEIIDPKTDEEDIINNDKKLSF